MQLNQLTWIYPWMVIALLVCGLQSQVASQESLNFQNEPLADALVKLSRSDNTNIFFSRELVQNKYVTIDVTGLPFQDALTQILYGRNIYFKKMNGQIVLYRAIRNKKKYTISGYIEDATSGERMIYASIFDFVTALGGETNEYGFYSISLPEGEVDITYAYLGYESHVERFLLNQDETINISLQPSLVLKEVTVYAEKGKTNILNGIRAGENKIVQADLEQLPSLGGALDIYRYLEILPGINTGTDGVGGIHVRGGSNDQNLILMDGVPLYNPAHLLGIFSIFNPNAISRFDVYKANFPARYSGRLSSVLDIHTREGNSKEWSGAMKISLASMDATFEGPLVKDKSSILVTGRWFLPSLVIRDLSRGYKERQGESGFTHLNFYDLNAKWNYQFSERSKIYASYFIGRDKFEDVSGFNFTGDYAIFDNFFQDSADVRENRRIQSDKNVNWGNRVAIGRWNYQWSDKVFMNANFSVSRYLLQSTESIDFRTNFNVDYRDPAFSSENFSESGFDNQEFKSDITDVGFRLDFDYLPSLLHRVKFGANLNRHKFLPKSISFDEEFKVDDFTIIEGQLENEIFNQFGIKATEWGVYIEDEWEVIRDVVGVNAGVHLSGFGVRGKNYVNPQLRLMLNLKPFDFMSLQVGVSEMTQYLHLLTNSGIGLPTDLWVPSTDEVAPQQSLQYSASLVIVPNDWLQIRLEGYHKDLKNQIAFQEGASFLVPAGSIATSILDAGNWENKVTMGTGESYGFETEWSVLGSSWRLKGAYSYAIANRTFEEINFGNTFPYRYNRKHSFNLTGGVDIGNRFSTHFNWVYGSGNNITLAQSKFSAGGSIFPTVGIIFGERNGFKLPDYHRFDLSLSYKIGAINGKAKQRFFADFYNLYDRENPFYVSLTEDPFSLDQKLIQYSIFGFIPSIGYSVEF